MISWHLPKEIIWAIPYSIWMQFTKCYTSLNDLMKQLVNKQYRVFPTIEINHVINYVFSSADTAESRNKSSF